MGKYEWRRKRELRKKEARVNIPEPMLDEFHQLTSSVAELPSDEDPETTPLHITFESYDEKICGIPHLNAGQPLAVVKVIRAMGKCRVRDDFLKNGVTMQPIIGADKGYSRLYRKFGDDVTVYEHRIDQISRIFYTVLFPQKLCHIIAITSTKHIE